MVKNDAASDENAKENVLESVMSEMTIPVDKDIDMKTQDAIELTSIIIGDIKQNLTLLGRAVSTIESRFTTRVLRTTASLRKKLSDTVLVQIIEKYYSKDHSSRIRLLGYLKEHPPMDMDGESPEAEMPPYLVESDVYLHLLTMIYLLDHKNYSKGIKLADETVKYIHSLNRRTLDPLAARVYFYYARFYELSNRFAEIRPTLLAIQRTATLRRDNECLATLTNMLLRNYFHYNLYDQADKLVSKSQFPESAGNNQLSRYLYYVGHVRAIQLNYTEAQAHLVQAIRKAPQNASTAGFQQAVHKMFIIVELLMGDIPEKSIFRQHYLKKALIPYLHIVQAVRIGDLANFQDTLAKYAVVFTNDRTYTLILRLRHNVIKTGIRMISLAYSRISLRDICLKLHLDSEEDAEYIVAKAIRDGVIDATLNHEHGYMQSKEVVDIYSTNEPQVTFHQRINFCLNLHNESVKAMRFPLNAHRKELASAEAARERERELVKEIAEGDLDDDEDGDLGDF